MRAAAERSAVELQESHFELAQKYKAAARGERRLQHMVVQLQDELSQLRDALSAKVDDGSPVRPKSRVDEVVHDRIMELQVCVSVGARVGVQPFVTDNSGCLTSLPAALLLWGSSHPFIAAHVAL